MASPDASARPPPVAARPASRALPAPPREIGPYAVVETVEARAFTVTYRAEQRSLGRTVLVKTLKSTVSAGSPFAAELEREAAVLGRLDHEGIVRVHELVRTADVLYLVLEDARAVPLDEVLRATRLEPEVAAAIALAAARALGHAHERGVVHRALRTAVVGIAPRGRVVLTDFSAAEAAATRVDDGSEPGPRHGAAADLPAIPEPIQAGESVTRPDSMAPEQILGETAGPASDVWALGVLCHELLTGTRPFEAEDPRAVAQRIRTGSPSPLPPAVPEALARIVARCLAKDPQDRFPDARAAAAAIEDALAPLSRLPVPVLVSRALAAAGRGEALPAPGAASHEPRAPASAVDVTRAARGLAVVLALIVVGGAALRRADDPDSAEGEGVVESAAPLAGSRDRGLVRVVAKPWAEVYLDGELVDVTPIGRPIPVLPGRHFVTFRHPNAPDEQREIKIAAGQSVFLDVTMRIDRGDAGAVRGGMDAGSP